MGVTSHVGIQVQHSGAVNAWTCGALAAILLSYIFFLTLDPATAESLSVEDALVENLGALFSLIASGLFVICYFRSGGANAFFGLSTKRNIWFLGLALLMFVVFGEEISWAQRIFGWETPATLEKLNVQGETNIHNLWFMHATHPDGTPKTSLELLLNANRLYSIFWLVYCVLVPLLFASSVFVRRQAEFLGIPIPPIVVGSVFVTNYLIFSLIVAAGGFDRETLGAFDELKETLYAFAFAVLAFCFLSTLPSRSRGGPAA